MFYTLPISDKYAGAPKLEIQFKKDDRRPQDDEKST